ncbi:glycosyltransferase [Acidiferrobacter sp.]
MRIVIDMQGAQAENCFCDIGRYPVAFAQAIAQARGKHEVILALNGAFPESIPALRETFCGLLPAENIRVWSPPVPVTAPSDATAARARIAELVRETFLAALQPDVVVITSLFERLGEGAVTSVGVLHHIPTAVILYDLIPLIHRQTYLADNPQAEAWYESKLIHLRRADLLLAISASSAQEAIDHLGFSPQKVVNVGTGLDARFHSPELAPGTLATTQERYGVHKPFVLYTGGIDPRKNIAGLQAAFARLPDGVRKNHQLVVVCAADPDAKRRCQDIAKQEGLGDTEFVMTGFVPESDLLALYRSCATFVFPSLHEGFGFPALEAMACGAPVIASNTSSLPEVVGFDDALFDPFDPDAIAHKLEQVLTDKTFRQRLIAHGHAQARRFTWDNTATRALSALDALHTEAALARNAHSTRKSRPRLAYVSPLRPARSGIAGYSAELLPELARFYDIEIIVDQTTVAPEWLRQLFPVRTPNWLRHNVAHYEHVLYHFGNSPFHAHMPDLLADVPGVVVLHDFFLSGLVSYMEYALRRPDYLTQALYRSHGYAAVMERFNTRDVGSVMCKFPVNGEIIANALGVIVHSQHSRQLAEYWYGQSVAEDWAVIPHIRVPAFGYSRQLAREQLGLPENACVVCSFGWIGPTQLNHVLLQAWRDSTLVRDREALLIFVGENHDGDYGAHLVATIKANGLDSRIRITGWVSTDTYHHYLAAADIAVQLRAQSRGETSGAILDCMNYGLATIVNAHASSSELPSDVALKLPDPIEPRALTQALETLAGNLEHRAALGTRARRHVLVWHNPRTCAAKYNKEIEAAYEGDRALTMHGLCAIARLDTASYDDLAQAASSLAALQRSGAHQLFLDVTSLVTTGLHSGIQRVVRAVLQELLKLRPRNLRVEPIYADQTTLIYRYARKWLMASLGFSSGALEDDPVHVQAGDVFLGVDLNYEIGGRMATLFQQWCNLGVATYFVVHDLLPVRMPQHFPPEAEALHTGWLEAVARADGALCVSKSVAEDLRAWLRDQPTGTPPTVRIVTFPLGSNIEGSLPTQGLPKDAALLLARLAARPSFLMVSTIEPRKGHAQTLAAFEQLWARGIDINLVIVGKQGWMVDALVDNLRSHKENGRRLFWPEDTTDACLAKIYDVSTCLIAASEGEGFGLPLIEAARHKLPIIARDIPVFREVCGEHAVYFRDTLEPLTIADAVRSWLALPSGDSRRAAQNIPLWTWKDSAERILQILGCPARAAEDAGAAENVA